MIVFKRLIAIIIFCSITSCSTTPQPVAYDCPTLTLPPDPNYPVFTLTASSPDDMVVKTWASSFEACLDWTKAAKGQVANS
jgi:hypothetical protein